MTYVPLTRPWLGDDEARVASDIIRSGMLVQGPAVASFEARLAERTARAHAIAVSNGTAALELALRAIGVGPGDDVLVPALTWPSPAHAARVVGANVVLVDVHADEWNSTKEAFLAARTTHTRALIVIDQFGNPARGPALSALATELDGVCIIEDAACALGSRFEDGAACGSLGVISCMSFHPRKVVTTGEGGVCLTDDRELADRLRMLRNHGQRGPGEFGAASGNHRLTDIQGAIGAQQMERLDDILAGRRQHAHTLREALGDLVSFQRPHGRGLPNYQTLGALLPPGTDADRRDEVLSRLRHGGVGAGLLSYDLTTIPTLKDAVSSDGPLPTTAPIAADIVRRGIALPLFPQMTDADIEHVAITVRAALS